MLLTRVGFLKLLGMMGIGQATRTQPTHPATQCLKPSLDHRGWEFTKCYADCEKGEEKCPLGHCQKPSLLYPVEYHPDSAAQTVDLHGKLHACSVCGIVYTLLK